MYWKSTCRGLALALALATAARADSLDLTPTKDNTLVQSSDSGSQLSNGLGDLFVGRTNQDGAGAATISIRRGLLAFDVAGSVPAGATITGVTLTLREVMGQNGDPSVTLHRVLQDWGEGDSYQNGGAGAAAADADATWLYPFYNAAAPASSPTWSTPGGDYDATASASAVIADDLGGGQLFTWDSAGYPQLLADVQGWLDQPADNFGWLLLGDESTGKTVKRFNSGESTAVPDVPPLLSISYVVPEPAAATLLLLGLPAVVLLRRAGRRRN